jgi:hypothetical protein
MKTYPMPGELMQKIVNYLQMRPYMEVAEMLGQMMQIAQNVERTQIRLNGEQENTNDTSSAAIS